MGGPMLDFAALDAKPLESVVLLLGLDHPSFPAVLAAAMPGVAHSRSSWPDEHEEHSLVHPASGSALRILIRWDHAQRRARSWASSIGPRDLWNELVSRLDEWERHSRTIPGHWNADAQRDDVAARSGPVSTRFLFRCLVEGVPGDGPVCLYRRGPDRGAASAPGVAAASG